MVSVRIAVSRDRQPEAFVRILTLTSQLLIPKIAILTLVIFISISYSSGCPCWAPHSPALLLRCAHLFRALLAQRLNGSESWAPHCSSPTIAQDEKFCRHLECLLLKGWNMTQESLKSKASLVSTIRRQFRGFQSRTSFFSLV